MAVIARIFITCISHVHLHVLQLGHTSATRLSEESSTHIHSSGRLMPFVLTVLVISFLFIHVVFHTLSSAVNGRGRGLARGYYGSPSYDVTWLEILYCSFVS